METKLFEVRDRATFVPCIATNLSTMTRMGHSEVSLKEYWLLRRVGFDTDTRILFGKLDGNKHYIDPETWNDRTFQVAHAFIIESWSLLKSGDVIDVEFILGETTNPKETEMKNPI
jgi:hypothetical protein